LLSAASIAVVESREWKEAIADMAVPEESLFGPEIGCRNVLDCTIAARVLEDLRKYDGLLILPMTSTFTVKYRSRDTSARLLDREKVHQRKTEDAELLPYLEAFGVALESQLPAIMVGTHDPETESFADSLKARELIKAYPEVKIRRFDTVTVMQCYTDSPGAAVSRALEGALAGWRSRVIQWAMVNIRLTMAKKQKEVHKGPSLKRSGGWGQVLAKAARRQMYGRRAGILFEGKPVDEYHEDPIEGHETIGGLRRTARSVAKLPGVTLAGAKLGKELDGYLDGKPEITTFILDLIDEGQKVVHDESTGSCDRCSSGCKGCKLKEITEEVRTVISTYLEAEDTEPVNDGNGMSTELRPGIFEAWRRASGDPETEVENWLRTGAPCGLTEFPKNTGVFAAADAQEETTDPSDILDENPILHATKVDEDEDALKELMGYVNKGYVKVFDSVKEACEFVGGALVLSDLVIVEKARPDGTIKRRVILNCKSSGVSKASTKSEKAVLPRVLDVVFDCLEACSNAKPYASGPEWNVDVIVADVEDAYWNIPILPEERKFFCTKLRGKIFVFLRATQGSRGGPLLWARTKAMAARMAQAVCECKFNRLNVYVDDPILIVVGTRHARHRATVKVLLIWLVLGLSIAWHKAQRGPSAVWTSARFDVTLQQVVVTIKPELIQAVANDIDEFLQGNLISIKRLRTLIGRAVHITSLVMFWTPFVAQLWAPIASSAVKSDAPPGCIWSKQIRSALLWIQAFVRRQRGTISRTYTVDAYLADDVGVQIVMDASPWGYGAVLVVEGLPRSYFAEPVSKEDTKEFGFQVGNSASQQVAESLCALLALRTWAQAWKLARCAFGIRSDSVTTLSLFLFCRAKGATMMRIAREAALDLAEGIYRPKVGTHVPGALNVAADHLSRLFEPNAEHTLPAYLADVQRVHPPPRDRKFFRIEEIPDTASQLQ